ncbi:MULTISPECIES: hypothetical protein [Actinomycetes]
MTSAPRGASGGPAGPERLGLLVLAVILVGLTLRSPIVGVPPVLGAIGAELAFSSTTAALLTSLPLLAFALLSPAVPQLMRRLGVDLTLLLCLVLLGAAILLRPWVGAAGLLLGTLAVGAAITMGNVVIPVLVRRDAREKVPQVMAASTSAYGLGQAVAAGAAVPVAVLAGSRADSGAGCWCSGGGGRRRLARAGGLVARGLLRDAVPAVLHRRHLDARAAGGVGRAQ